jgi:hypothetical protein
MHRIRIGLLLLVGMLALIMAVPEAHAQNAVLYTSPLSVGSTSRSALFCNVVNVSGSPVSGTLQIFSLSGESLSVASYNDVAPGGGTGIAIFVFPQQPPVTLAYCKVTVRGPRNTIRANLILASKDGSSIAAVEAR